jgi:thiopeptide-type bacteriocin biosynthesis protein
MDHFIVHNLASFAERLNQEVGIDGWYFVRYGDPEKHVCFRVRLHSAELAGGALALLEEATINWMEAGLIKNMVISSYEREIERYGGVEYIEDAEAVFCADTFGVIQLICSSLNKTIGWDAAVLHALSVIGLLKDFDLSQEEMFILLDGKQSDQSALQGFRKHKGELLSLAKALEEGKASSIELAPIREASSVRSLLFKRFRAQPSKMRLEIYNSMLHMHCNRLGCDAMMEKRARLYARHTLQQLTVMADLKTKSSLNSSF